MVKKAGKVKKSVDEEESKKPVEKSVEEDKSIPKRYYLQFWKKIQPSDSRFDVVAGTVYWSDVKQNILIESLHNNYSSEVENLLTSDLALPNGVFVSRNEAPKEWIKNAPKATLGYGFYALATMEIVDETE